jgi:hypothetical protein
MKGSNFRIGKFLKIRINNFLNCANFFFAVMKTQKDERGRRILLGDNTGGLGFRTPADPISVCWSLDFSWNSLSVYTVDNMHALNSVLRRYAWRCTLRNFEECVPL